MFRIVDQVAGGRGQLVGPTSSPEQEVYRAEVSCATTEDSLDLLSAHSIKVVGHRNLPHHETDTAHLSTHWSVKRRDFYNGLTCLRDHERLSFRCLVNEL